MTIFEASPPEEEILDFVNDRIRDLREAGHEAKYILLGPSAYSTLRRAMASRFNRSEGVFETYNYVPIVVDPERGPRVCVLPAPVACADGARLYQLDG